MVAVEWSPLVDISEDDRGNLIKADLPDVKKEEVKVTAQEGVPMPCDPLPPAPATAI